MRTRRGVTAYIGLGANLGDRAANIRAALEKLSQSPGVELVAVSNLIETQAIGGPTNSPPYLNGAAKVETTLAAHALLNRLLEIEHEMGRRRGGKWEPRPIDLDLLLYNGQIISSQELVVPHPLMHERLFVLQPLAEIAPQAVHPTLQMTIAGLMQDVLAKRDRLLHQGKN